MLQFTMFILCDNRKRKLQGCLSEGVVFFFVVVDINGTITAIFNRLVQEIVNVLYGCK